MKEHKTKCSILEWLLVISAIAASATPLSSLFYTQTALLFLLLAVVLFARNKIGSALILRFRPKSFLSYALIVACIMATWIANMDPDVNYYLGLVALITACYFTTEAISFEKFRECYILIIKIICIYSVIITALLNISRGLLSYLPLVYQKGDVVPSWRTLFYLYNVWDLSARFTIVRNSACFREPGVWGSFASLAVVFKLYSMQRKRVSKTDIVDLLILSVGAVVSLSTATFFSLFLCFIIYFFMKRHSKKEIAVFTGIIILGVFIAFANRELLFSKFLLNNTSSISLLDRISGVSGSVQSWLNSPIIGSGYTKYFQFVTTGVNTFSYLFLLGEFGLVLFAVFIYQLLRLCRFIGNNIMSTITLFVLITLILNTQNLIFTPLIMLPMIYSGTQSIRKKNYQTTTDGRKHKVLDC